MEGNILKMSIDKYREKYKQSQYSYTGNMTTRSVKSIKLPSGHKINQYTSKEKLGRGTFSTVY